MPILIGSGTRPENLRPLHALADGFIVGSYFKKDGMADNEVEPTRVKDFAQIFGALS